MDYNLLSQVVAELSAVLTGARLGRVYQDSAGNICMAFDRARKAFTLVLSPDRSLPRLHLLSKRPHATDPPSGFVQYLRGRLAGARTLAAGLMNEDRIAEFRFTKSGKEFHLVFELFGPSPNLVLTDASGTILALYRPVPPGEGTVRTLLAGMRYAPPERKPSRADKHFGGPAEGDVQAPLSQAETPFNRVAEERYEGLLREREIAGQKKELAALLKKARSRAARREEAIRGDLASSEQAEDCRQAGELILANLASIPRGAAAVDLTAYDGRTAPVTLDPALSAAKNADRYFKKYKKAKTGASVIRRRLADARAEVSSLNSLLSELDHAVDLDALLELRSAAGKHGLLKVRTAAPAGRGASPWYRKYESSGWEILVGKSAAGNDYVTQKLARPDDLWLHAEGMPGSHVLIRNPGAHEVPPGVLEKAASLAAYFSKGRDAGKVPVAYTAAKFVKKPKGAKPGAVTLVRRRTLMAAPARGVPDADVP